ncbi:asparagine synthase (glutamine-hydrolyzing) [Trinickia dinghuensis]|uniref:asparagine synthase (glutamine-hydrolyzing) n=1 Tax=Trinickia dinghuensis TaxID=2291023 RepID=A0A3D8JPC9_9BURK|nr:asparagine synthase (glutamine-hydrolyzing) [Trinickia dinghuensis]RDU94959.1 asparagine synthase (glutamine-hydrolyzing) [Trinickia dinghuensis]
MCRMFGLFGRNKRDKAIECIEYLKPGGPDEQNVRFLRSGLLGHTRLSINGPLNGSQPYALDGRHCIFVGEIYNHRALSATYGIRRYEGDSDGCVILPLFDRLGPRFVEQLDGMFAIAIVDTRQNDKLYLYTDSVAVKPVYYKHSTGSLSFASEIEALPDLDDSDRTVRASSFDTYGAFRSFLGAQTIFSNIKVLEPTTYLTFDGERASIERYVPSSEQSLPGAYDAAGFSGDLRRAAGWMTDADVPVCSTLSGGIDSSLVAALSSRDPAMSHAFNVWYEGDWQEDETAYAKMVAAQAGIEYHQVTVENVGFPDLIQRMCRALSQPNAAAHCLSTFRLYEAISASRFRVALVGEGADDFFGGYDRMVQVATASAQEEALFAYITDLAAIPSSLRTRLIEPEAVDMQYAMRLKDFIRSLPGNTWFRKVLHFEAKHRLPYYILHRVDALSMAHSVEARVPFCLPSVYRHASICEDEQLVDRHSRKRPIYDCAKGILPEAILTRQKQPFLLPIAGMLRPGYAVFDYLMDTLHSSCRTLGFVKREVLLKCIEENMNRPTSALGNSIWAWLIFEVWANEHNITFR